MRYDPTSDPLASEPPPAPAAAAAGTDRPAASADIPAVTLAEGPAGTEPPALKALWARDSARVADAAARESSPETLWVALMSPEGRCLAAGQVTPAERSQFLAATRLAGADVARAVAVGGLSVEPQHRDHLLPAVLYACLRRARIWDRAVVVTHAAEGSALARLAGLDRLTQLPPGAGGLVPMAQRLDVAIHRAWTASGPAQRSLQALLVPEAVETLDRWIGVFFQGPFFRAVHEGRFTRQQYACSLGNLHQFVRWTTRLIGRAVSLSHDPELRNHWLNHLGGEVNHELIIEKDLKLLGEDPKFVADAMLPSVPTLGFMVAQESAIAFHQDPVLFMAAPFVAEGFASRLDGRFMEAVERCVKSWGVPNPKLVTVFYSSHIRYDGGEDGHWAMTRSILARHLQDDRALSRFLGIQRLAQRAFEEAYGGFVTDLQVFSAQPQPGR